MIRLEMLVEMQIEILNGGQILVNWEFKLKQNLNLRIWTARYRGIQIQYTFHLEFVLRDTEEFLVARF